VASIGRVPGTGAVRTLLALFGLDDSLVRSPTP